MLLTVHECKFFCFQKKHIKISPLEFSLIQMSLYNYVIPKLQAEKEQRLYKTERCRFFLQGICTRGAKCKYAHGRDLRPKEVHALYKTRFCHYFLDGKECPYGVKNRCSFKHEIFNPEEFEEFKKAVERRMKASQHKPQE
jgi:hypothetical protein